MRKRSSREWLTDRISTILKGEEAVLDPLDADNLAHVVVDGLFSTEAGPRIELDEIFRELKLLHNPDREQSEDDFHGDTKRRRGS